jgi:hypothetical protein
MPRARSQVVAIIEQLDETREKIKRLNETLQDVCRLLYKRTNTDHRVQLTSAGATSGPTPPISGVAEEEHRITDLQNRLMELRSQVRSIFHVRN